MTGSVLMATDLEVGIRHRVLGMKVEQPGAVILPTAQVGSILRTSDDLELGLEADGDHLVDPWPALGVHPAGRGPEPLSRGSRLRRDELSCGRGRRPEEADPADDLRHRRREHPVRPGRRAGGADRRVDHHGRHRRPPAGQDVGPGRRREQPGRPDRQPGHPGQGAETDRAQPGRRRSTRAPGHPVGVRRAGADRAGGDLQPAGRRAIPPLPGRLPGQRRGRRSRWRPARSGWRSSRPRSSPARRAGASTSGSATGC